MELTHAVRVDAPVAPTWALLEDLGALLAHLPGAELTTRAADSCAGTLTVRIGPLPVVYEGTVTVGWRDPEARRVVLEVEATERDGVGEVHATLHVTLAADGGATRAAVVTNLRATGRAAQLGRGVLTDLGDRLLADLVAALPLEPSWADAAVSDHGPVDEDEPEDDLDDLDGDDEWGLDDDWDTDEVDGSDDGEVGAAGGAGDAGDAGPGAPEAAAEGAAADDAADEADDELGPPVHLPPPPADDGSPAPVEEAARPRPRLATGPVPADGRLVWKPSTPPVPEVLRQVAPDARAPEAEPEDGEQLRPARFARARRRGTRPARTRAGWRAADPVAPPPPPPTVGPGSRPDPEPAATGPVAPVVPPPPPAPAPVATPAAAVPPPPPPPPPPPTAPAASAPSAEPEPAPAVEPVRAPEVEPEQDSAPESQLAPDVEPEPESAPEPEPAPASAPDAVAMRPVDVVGPPARWGEGGLGQRVAPAALVLLVLWVLRRVFGSRR